LAFAAANLLRLTPALEMAMMKVEAMGAVAALRRCLACLRSETALTSHEIVAWIGTIAPPKGDQQ
jgi:hypothetical protein